MGTFFGAWQMELETHTPFVPQGNRSRVGERTGIDLRPVFVAK